MRVLAFDTETTDLNGFVIEFACVLLNLKTKKVEGFCATAVNPLARVSPFVVKKFAVNERALRNYPTFDEIWLGKVKELFERADILVAHNIEFDLKVLSREAQRWQFSVPQKEVFCTCQGAKELLNLHKRPKLEELAKKVSVDFSRVERFYETFLLKSCYNPDSIRTSSLKFHNALYDTAVLTFAYVKLLKLIRRKGRWKNYLILRQ